MKKIIAIITAAVLCAGLASCAGNAASAANAESAPAESKSAGNSEKKSDNGAAETANVNAETAKIIVFDGGSVKADNEGVSCEGADAVITEEGVYTVRGSTGDGSVTVNAPGKEVRLILDGVDIKNPRGPAVLFKDAESAYLEIAGNNKLEDGGESEYDGALYGAVSYTIGGEGALEVNGTAEEGIASEMHLTIEGGDITVNASDDGINANNDGVSKIAINGGKLNITAGGDGIDSNGSIEFNGGEVLTYGSYDDMNGGIDADGEVTINGGTIFASGAATSPVTGGKQKYLIYNFEQMQKSGSKIAVSRDGDTLFETVPANDYSTIVFSSNQIEDGVDYVISVDGVEAGTINTQESAQADAFGPAGNFEKRPGAARDGEPPEFNGERPEFGGERPQTSEALKDDENRPRPPEDMPQGGEMDKPNSEDKNTDGERPQLPKGGTIAESRPDAETGATKN